MLLGSALGGCAPAAAPVSPSAPVRAVDAGDLALGLELTGDQRALRERLVAHQRHLVERVGERNQNKSWELADAADYLVGAWEKSGLVVEYAGYAVDGRPLSNLGVRFEGTDLAHEIVEVLVAYDSECGSTGESAAATTAVLVELGRSLASTRFRRTVQLWALATSECVARPEERGSRALEEARKRPVSRSFLPDAPGSGAGEVVLAIHLRHLGHFARVPDAPYTRLVELRASSRAGAELELFRENLEGEGLALDMARLPEGDPTFSDLEATLASGIPGVLVAGLPAEGPIEADFLALVAWRLAFAVGRVGLEVLTNDGMLTPDLGRVR